MTDRELSMTADLGKLSDSGMPADEVQAFASATAAFEVLFALLDLPNAFEEVTE